LPTEIEFYRKVKSQYIPKVFYSHSDGFRHWLLLEDAGKHYPDNLNKEQILNLAYQARKIINGLGTIEVYRYDLSEKHYTNFVDALIELLQNLYQNQKLKTVDGIVIARIEKMLSHPEVLCTIRSRCGLLHGDLKCNNLLIRPNGEMCIIDWQSVLYGPEDIDIYQMMASQSIDPVPLAGIGPEILRSALAIMWLTECIDHWLPYWAEFYDGQIADIEKHMQRLVKEDK
jgi:serine/threonine protein kinase